MRQKRAFYGHGAWRLIVVTKYRDVTNTNVLYQKTVSIHLSSSNTDCKAKEK